MRVHLQITQLIKTATRENKDIILIRDFNEVISEDPKMTAQIIAAARLTDVHAPKHGHDKNIATYIQDRRRVDYCFVSPRIIDHVNQCGL